MEAVVGENSCTEVVIVHNCLVFAIDMALETTDHMI